MAKQPSEEIRKLVCKCCKSEIDEVGCITGCEYDNGQRPPESMEFNVYILAWTEPYEPRKK